MTLGPELLAASVPGGGAPLTIWSSLLPDIGCKISEDTGTHQPCAAAFTSTMLRPPVVSPCKVMVFVVVMASETEI